MALIVEGRKAVEEAADEAIRELESKIFELLEGRRFELFFHLLYVGIISDLTTVVMEQTSVPGLLFRNAQWMKATSGMIDVINKLLDRLVPVDTKIDDEGAIDSRLFITIATYSLDLAKWLHVRKAEWVTRIKVDGLTCSDSDDVPPEKAILYLEYVNSASISKDAAYWNNYKWNILKMNRRFRTLIDTECLKRYGIGSQEIVNSSIALDNFTNGDFSHFQEVSRNKIFDLISDRASGNSEKIIDSYTFSRGSDVRMRPLIPTKNGKFLIADWVFHPTPLHFESWIGSILEDRKSKSHGLYNKLVGKDVFEDYVFTSLKETSGLKIVGKGKKLSQKIYPEIIHHLVRLQKEGGFEIDLIARLGNSALLISCKGGEKEMPRSLEARKWGTFPNIEIENAAENNLKTIHEITVEAECIASHKRIQNDLGLAGCNKFFPVAIYSKVQPLSLESFQEHYDSPKVLVTTVQQLKSIIRQQTRLAEFHYITTP